MVTSVILVLTALFFAAALRVEIHTVFDDLMPTRHPYVRVHQEFKETFGGSNVVSIMIQVKDGDIFQPKILEKIRAISRDLRMVTGVNEFQIISLAAKKLKDIKAGTFGIETRPLMFPDVPQNSEDVAKLRESVLANPLVYGTYVSADLKAALITVDFIDRLMDFTKVFHEVTEIVNRHRGEGYEIRVVGEPILQGIIKDYIPQTVILFVGSVLFLGLILFVFFMRSWRGTLIPISNAVISAIWALGIASLLGLNIDPLGLVIGFLVTARVISHSVQSVNRFDMNVAERGDIAKVAAAESLASLFRPGMLSVVADALCILVVTLAPIPLLQKSAVVGTIWISCIAVTGVILTPVLLSWVRHPDRYVHNFNVNPLVNKFLVICGVGCTSKARYAIFYGTLALILVSGYVGSRITIGDANPGTPLLWQNSEYNQSVAQINKLFLGTDRMFVVFRGDDRDSLKETEVVQRMIDFQTFVERQPEIGGSMSLVDLIPAVKSILNEGNPRFKETGAEKFENGEILFMYLGGSDPGDLDYFSDASYKNGSVTIFFRDHQGGTIRNAIAGMKQFIHDNPVQGGHFELAGGLIGVLAAVNEVIFSGQVESIAYALLVVLVTAALTYRSGIAGIYFILPILVSNTVTFAYMAIRDIGLNINSLPVAALGIGLGVDYSIYVVDAIMEEYSSHGDMKQAVFGALNNAGRGVLLTAIPLVLSTTVWYFFSSLRFQAEMALLIAIWMTVSTLSALLLMPAMCYLFRPKFIIGKVHGDEYLAPKPYVALSPDLEQSKQRCAARAAK
jgi:hypothetical protein